MPLLNAEQLNRIAIAERTTSCVSFACNVFVIVSFLTYRPFNRPINRLIFFASWINLLCDVSDAIARAGIEAGENSKLCQFQGFLIQWSHVSNAYWNLAMALNVFLVFYRRFDVQKLRKLEPYYMAFCYVVPLIPALVYLFNLDESKGHVYGNATIWCYIRSTWSPLRFATEYGPAWACCLTMIAIYIAVSIKIFKMRRRVNRLGGQYCGLDYRRDIWVTHTFTVHSVDEILVPPPPASQKSGETESIVPLDNDAIEEDIRPLRHRAAANDIANNAQSALTTFDAATMAYYRFGGLYFIAMVATWVPPSVSRTLSTINPSNQIYVAFLLHGMSLSSQGFWNTVIYVGTSWPACKAMWRDIKERLRRQSTQSSRRPKTVRAGTSQSKDENKSRVEMKGQVMAMFEYKTTTHTRIKDGKSDGA